MPNYCYNSLTIEGNTDDDKALDAIFSKDNPFQAIYPCPEELDSDMAHTWGGENRDEQDTLRAQLTEKYGYGCGNSWRSHEWGTKWDACDIQNQGDGCFNFETAWGPPIQLYEKMSELYPNARFTFDYEESGVGFQGEGAYLDEIFSNQSRDYVDSDDPDVWEPEVTEQSKKPQVTVIGAYTIPKLP